MLPALSPSATLVSCNVEALQNLLQRIFWFWLYQGQLRVMLMLDERSSVELHLQPLFGGFLWWFPHAGMMVH